MAKIFVLIVIKILQKNINNKPECEILENNKLEKLFGLQISLQKKFGNIPFRDLKHKQEFINLMILACLDELSESLRETAWKNPNYISCGWKNTQVFNEDKFKEELIDLWHFIINLSIASGMDEEELFLRFMDKNKENNLRKDRGY